MADTTLIDKLSLSPEQQDSDRLMKHLEETYNMPNEEWWISVDAAFQHLRTLLEKRPNEAFEDDDDPQSISAQAARADALPLVSLLPSGSHAMQLTATNEDLQCVAFGTISVERYVDIFWEAAIKVQDDGGKFMVYQVETSSFWFNFEGHNFHLHYVCCENLVRKCPGILNVSDEAVREADAHTQKIVEGIKRDTKKRAFFSKRYQRASFHYLRAWTIARGRYTPNHRLTSTRTLSFQGLIKIMDPQELLDIQTERAALRRGLKPEYLADLENPVFSMYHNVSDIFQNLNEKVLSLPPYSQPVRTIDTECRPAQLSIVLQKAEDGSVHSNLQMPLYIQVNLIYWGSSDLECGKWLSMVEHRLSKLKERLETTDPRPDEVCLYPHRLLDLERDSRDSEGGYWAGSYILGLRRFKESGSDKRVTSTWNLQTVANNTVIPKDDCSIKTVYMTANDFNDENLILCPRTWPRPELAVDREKSYMAKLDDGLDKPQRTSKHQKSREQPGSEESHTTPKRLRPARAVLSRLRHDPTFNIDEYKVGYLDRHTVVPQEKPVAFWATDTTDDLFIPEHRILYFKRCRASGEELLMWHKAEKIDRIFTAREVIVEENI